MSGNLELGRAPTTLNWCKTGSLSLIYANSVVGAEHLLLPWESGMLVYRGRVPTQLVHCKDPGH